ncbi:MAG: phosphoribosylaminoimidazolesuccinocarboxamide synthase [Gemmatimonas sp.]|nr:phosphoribosylaminoimidazolesuccinocarboxamide synthase [Gemmatimonas sp.]
MNETVARTDLPVPLLRRGKVRDIYDLGEALLMVASDRVSAFDVILPQPIPRKGEVLTLISAWWFARTSELVPNHLLSVDPEYITGRFPALARTRDIWSRRAMLVRKLDPFPVECVVRGYIAGSAWQEYRSAGTLAGEALPEGLAESARLEAPLFSPATKAEEGHDENITFEGTCAIVGKAAAEELRRASILLYERGRELALSRGILIADTKFEFGRDEAGAIRVMDEILTPDSSRFWPADSYIAGRTQPSFDKQPVRDYLEGLVQNGEWDRQPPAPDLPDEQVLETSRRYQEAFVRITGVPLDEVPLSTWGGT